MKQNGFLHLSYSFEKDIKKFTEEGIDKNIKFALWSNFLFEFL